MVKNHTIIYKSIYFIMHCVCRKYMCNFNSVYTRVGFGADWCGRAGMMAAVVVAVAAGVLFLCYTQTDQYRVPSTFRIDFSLKSSPGPLLTRPSPLFSVCFLFLYVPSPSPTTVLTVPFHTIQFSFTVGEGCRQHIIFLAEDGSVSYVIYAVSHVVYKQTIYSYFAILSLIK